MLALWYDWHFWARPKQLPPPGDWFCWLLRSGRGAGKTRTGAEWVIEQARERPKSHGALIGQTKSDVRDTMIELGESSILRISPPWFMPEYQPSKRRVVWPNGTVATIYSGDEPGQLRGPAHDWAWADELAKYKYPKDAWDNMELGMRQGLQPRVCVTTTPRPIPLIKALIADPMTVDVRESTYSNVANLAPSFVRRILTKYEGTHLGRQELHGEILEDREGALWNRAEMIEPHRVSSCPPLLRVVVAVDPPGGATECGIVTAGVAVVDGVTHGYVLGDNSLMGSPATWGLESVTAYNLHSAGCIVGEANFGGDMVEHTIRAVDGGADVSYKAVRASRGKAVRAEPIAAYYQQGRVHHVGQFADLEDELCSWVPDEGLPSPNRLDALVWALTELLVVREPKKRTVRVFGSG